jgi:hypothetical protein
MMGDRLGDGETGVSDFVVPLDFFILYCNAKAIAGLLVTRKFSYFIVTLLKNLRLSNIPRTYLYQPHWALLGFCPTITENELSLMPYSTRLIKMDRVGLFEPTTSAQGQVLSSLFVLCTIIISIHTQYS